MTRLTKAVARECDGGKHGPLIVSLTPHGVVIREKGRNADSAVGPLPYAALFDFGMKAKANAEYTAKLTERARARRGSFVRLP